MKKEGVTVHTVTIGMPAVCSSETLWGNIGQCPRKERSVGPWSSCSSVYLLVRLNDNKKKKFSEKVLDYKITA